MPRVDYICCGVACRAEVPRNLFDVHAETGSATPREALNHIAGLYAVQYDVRSKSPGKRRCGRQDRAGPLPKTLRHWLDGTGRSGRGTQTCGSLSATRSPAGRADPQARYRRLEIDDNAAGHSLRAIAIGLTSWLFADSNQGGRSGAHIYSLRSRGLADRYHQPSRRLFHPWRH
ncbi:IS66 family transposase [Sphingomonas sp. Leaf34]|uniref:IS66 family transposase n=1 Tax=Sphingomonas sp. Leaf34 TaxID=1736216 RepID=UPI00138EFF95